MGRTQDALDRAVEEIGEAKNIQAGAILAMDTLGTIVRENVNDPTALLAALDDFDNAKVDLAAAIVRNTQAASEPPPPPPTE